MPDPLLSLHGVHTHIGHYHILHGVDLVVPEGRLTMLLGRNGAGKTTTLRTIMGLWRASAGEIRFAGADITRMATPDIARLGIAYDPVFVDGTRERPLDFRVPALSLRGDVSAARLPGQPSRKQ